MPEDKEGSAVAALLNEINKLRERVEALEIYTGAYMTRGRDRTSDTIGGYSGSYTSLNDPIPIRPSVRDVISYRGNYEDDTIYAIYEDGTRFPVFTNPNSDAEPRTFASCRSSHS